jgi:hypothetical protein
MIFLGEIPRKTTKKSQKNNKRIFQRFPRQGCDKRVINFLEKFHEAVEKSKKNSPNNEIWMENIDGKHGWEIWMGIIDRKDGREIWMGNMDGKYGWEL